MMVAHSWRLLVYGRCLLILVASLLRWLVLGSYSSMVAACSFQLLIPLSCDRPTIELYLSDMACYN